MKENSIITDSTEILELTDQLYSDRCVSRGTGIRRDVCSSWNNWYKHNKKWYYYKNYGHLDYSDYESRFLNELLGEYFARKLGADSVHYVIAGIQKYGERKSYGLASESFVQKSDKYLFVRDMDISYNYANTNNLRLLRSLCSSDENYNELLSEIYKLTALDIYMSQDDRHERNVQFRKHHKDLHLAPLYDFEFSFKDPYDLRYESCILGLNVDALEEYPGIKEELDKLFALNMRDVLGEIEEERKIIVPRKQKTYYRKFVDTRREYIK